jgi:uncharacterized cupin superfamily protein
MPKLDLDAIPQDNATGYPPPFDREVQGRWKRRVAKVAGITDFGATHAVLKPGAWSSQRHWHDGEDELLVMLSGEAVLVEDEGRTTVRAGDICVWPKGTGNGHHLRNESDQDCSFLVFSGGTRTGGGYSDIDMMFTADDRYVHKDGTPYDAKRV